LCADNTRMRTIFALTLAIACFMATASQNDDFGPMTELVDTTTEGDLMGTLDRMQKVAPTHMHFHINRIAKHAALLQIRNRKAAKAYSHNFDASKAAIKAALQALTNQLNAGHTHDKAALAAGINEGNAAIAAKKTEGKSKCQTFKDKACPTKREEMEADAAKANAKKVMQDVGKGQVCSGLTSSWGDMDVDKETPKYGDELRNKWDKKRSEYESAKGKFDAAVKTHNDAIKKHNAAMAEFSTALTLEARNAVDACNQAHKEYKVLADEVRGNVQARKQVFIATLVVTCYVDNLTDNGVAKTCADKKRNASTSQWNITPAVLTPCNSKAELTNEFGPANWLPTSGKCSRAWHEASGKLIFQLA